MQTQYYRHPETGIIFDTKRDHIKPEAMAEMEPYFPTRFVRDINTGRIFGWTIILANRPDMEPHGELITAPPQKEEKEEPRTARPEDDLPPTPNTAKLLKLIAAINSLDPESYLERGGPTKEELQEIAKVHVSQAERDEAWSEFTGEAPTKTEKKGRRKAKA
jgi:hypothetical protein